MFDRPFPFTGRLLLMQSGPFEQVLLQGHVIRCLVFTNILALSKVTGAELQLE
jgi:hypothetical protein